MTEYPLISDNEKGKALEWLREVLAAILDVAPLSYWQKKRTARFLKGMPDWLMASWAEALNIDFVGGFRQFPDIAVQARSDTGRNLAQQYLEAHDAVPTANILDDLVRDVVKEANESRLPKDRETVEKQVCALALAGCAPEGAGFTKSAESILNDTENINHPIVGYHLALTNRDEPKVEALDAALAGGRYGEWAAERLTEIKRYLGLEPSHFIVRHGERTPHWDLLWQKIFTGGDEN